LAAMNRQCNQLHELTSGNLEAARWFESNHGHASELYKVSAQQGQEECIANNCDLMVSRHHTNDIKC
jgi:hypothetical protein